MAKFFVLAVTGRQPPWGRAACEGYLGRLPRGFEARLVPLKAEPRAGGKPAARLLAAEAARVRAAVPRGARLVVLDERGRDLSSAQFAARLGGWAGERRPTAFVIGGPDGLDATLKREAELLWRLSALTLPHALAQVLLCEQLYRAASLLAGHPYHRG